MALVEPMLTTVLEQDPADSSWRVTAPANVTADLRQSITTARTLGRLRAEDIVALSSAEAGFPSSTRIEITLLDGRRQVLEIGDAVAGREPGDEAVYVRTAAAPERVGVLPSSTLSELRRAWAR